MPYFTILDRFIIRKFLTTFFYTIAIFLSISVVFDISEKMDDLIANHAPLKVIVFDYYFSFIPYFGILFSPMVVFISVIYFTSKMAYDSEIVPMFSSGISFNRILFPYFIAAFILASLAYFANHWLVPDANKKRIAFENTYINSRFVNTSRNIHLQLDEQNYIFMDSYNNADSVGYKFALEKIVDDRLVFKLRAEKIEWQSKLKKWRIKNYVARTNEPMEEKLTFGAVLDTAMNFSPMDFEEKIRNVVVMNSSELNKFIKEELAKGDDKVVFYQVEKHKRTAMPFATFILTLIGVSLASRKVRGGKGLHIALGILISFAYIVFMQFSTTLSTNAGFSPLLGVWTPNILFTVLAIYLLKAAPK